MYFLPIFFVLFFFFTGGVGADSLRTPRTTSSGIEFIYRSVADLQSVALIGTFNGWNRKSHPMEKTNSQWHIALPLDEGQYEYKFILNDTLEISDPLNPLTNPDGSGNSMFFVLPDRSLDTTTAEVGEDSPGIYYRLYQAQPSPDWAAGSIIYELFPRVYTAEANFKGLTQKLPYLNDLGINVLWLMPIYPIGEVKRKGALGSPYSVKDYQAINPEFGASEDFREWVQTAHSMGFKVILDWVANHCAWDNPMVEEHPDWFTRDADGEMVPPYPDWSDVVDFDYHNTGLQAYMIKSLLYWVETYDIDGFRCDVAGLVPAAFWVAARRELLAIKPSLLLLAESEEPMHHIKGFDVTYDGSLRRILGKIANGKATQDEFWLNYYGTRYLYPRNSLRMRWLENHDQIRSLEYFGEDAIYPASVALLTLDEVPLILMGQEFGDLNWRNWQSLFDPLQLEWFKNGSPLYQHYRELIRIRRENPVFSTDSVVSIRNDNPWIVSYVRRDPSATILVFINMSNRSAKCRLNPEDWNTHQLPQKLRGQDIFYHLPFSVSFEQAVFELKPWGFKILKLE